MRAGATAISACAMARRASARPSPHDTMPIGRTSEAHSPCHDGLGGGLAAVVGSTPSSIPRRGQYSRRSGTRHRRFCAHLLRMLVVDAGCKSNALQYAEAAKQEEARVPPTRSRGMPTPPTARSSNLRDRHPAGSPSAMPMPRRRAKMPDPTTLVIIDEADRLKTASWNKSAISLTKAAWAWCSLGCRASKNACHGTRNSIHGSASCMRFVR